MAGRPVGVRQGVTEFDVDGGNFSFSFPLFAELARSQNQRVFFVANVSARTN